MDVSTERAESRTAAAAAAGAPPLVSQIVLTFDQARYVAESLESAFAQDYPNLEIVVSDHGSTDGTFEIVAGLARSYRGPHRLRVGRSASPLGVLGHAFEAIAASRGRLVVAASGDDVSRPDRVSRLAERWRATGAEVLWSRGEKIDEQGRTLPPPPRPPLVHDAAHYFPDGGVCHVHGATAAYDRRALDALPRPDFPVMSEDFFFSIMLGLRAARFEFLDEPLVRCRRHRASLSTRAGTRASLAARERATADYSAQAARLLRFAERAALAGPADAPRLDLGRLRADLAFHEARAGWHALGPARRLASLRHVRSRAQLRWMVPRLLGSRALAALQRIR